MLDQQVLLSLVAVLYSSSLIAQPMITSFSPSSAMVGAAVTIKGSNFNAVAANNVVYFGAVRGSVTVATTTQLTVTVPLRATTGYITVSTNNFTGYSRTPFNLISGSNLSPQSYVMRWGFGVTGSYPSPLAVGDLDGDGRPDLIGANFNTNNLSIFRSTSFSGTVQVVSEVKWATGIKPEGMALGDVNRDGRPDLVVTSIDDHLISIFLNTSSTGAISFAPRLDISAGPQNWPRGVAIHDLDGDGLPDLVVADNNKIYSGNNTYGTVSVYRNTSGPNNLSFGPPVVLQAGEYPRKVCIADLDGDSSPDVAVTDNSSGSVSVFRNNGGGGTISFSAGQHFTTGSYPEQVVLGDLNGDGKADMVVSNFGSSTLSVFQNASANGSISFGSKQDIAAVSPLGIAIGDISGDGKPDLVAASFSTGKVSAFANASSANTISFAPKMDYASGDGPVQVSIGDMDGDGYPDISVTNSTINFISVLRMEPGTLSVNLGNDVTLCEGDSVALTANAPNVQYLWSTGSSANSIVVKQPGRYWVRVTNGTASASDTVQVSVIQKPVFDLGKDTVLCEGQSLVLKPKISGTSYLWQDGSMADSMVAAKDGTYWLQLQKAGCTAADTLVVNIKAQPVLNIGNDRTLCPGSTVLLDAFDPSIQSYTWQDKTTLPQLTVQKPGPYWVTVTGANGCSNSDTVQITASPLAAFSLGNDTTLCDNTSLRYELALAGADYLWNNGAVSGSFSISTPGTYWVQLSQDGCVKRDSIIVSFVPTPLVDLGNDTTLCRGFARTLDAFTPNAVYLWSMGASTPAITVTDKGSYWVAVNSSGCIVTDTILINYKDPPSVLLKADTLLCEGQSLVLNPQINSGSLVWQDGSTAPSYPVTSPGTYKITVSNECGVATDQITITNGLCKLLMPDAFTPNSDGLNDIFRVKYPGFIKSFHMQIVNRWGQKIYDSANPYQGWDGKLNGVLLPSGNYIWMIWLTDISGKSSHYKGSVLLIR